MHIKVVAMENETVIVTNKKCDFPTFFSLVGVTVGFSAFITFFILNNYDAGVWAFASFMVAAICFYLNYLDLKQKIPEKYDIKDVADMQGLGIVFTAIGLSGTLWYIFKFFYYHIPVMPVEHSVVIAMVWSFMTMKWGFQLTYYTHVYKNNLRNSRLLP